MVKTGTGIFRLLLLIGAVFMVSWAVAAEGTMEESWARQDFDNSCAACHGTTPEYPLLGARLGYDASGHKNNDNSYYANGAGCQICHTNEGFIDYVKTGKVDPASTSGRATSAPTATRPVVM